MTTGPVFVVTIDTEADNEWARGPVTTYRNIVELPRFQVLCDRYGVRPTYLVAYDVADDPTSRGILQDLLKAGNCEIGAHLHAWRTPPFVDELEADRRFHPYLHEYPVDTQGEKLSCLTDSLTAAFGHRPTSYRGGRWSLNNEALALLEERGYIVDTTVTPGISWRHMPGRTIGGSSFVGARGGVYRPATGDLTREGSRQILEVPVTIGVRGALARVCYADAMLLKAEACFGYRTALRAAKKLRLARPVWLHPAKSSLRDLLWVCATSAGVGVLNMMFHSSELVAGGAPAVPDESRSREVWERVERVFESVCHQDIRCVTLSELAGEQAR